jgi:hypothetical protein
MVMFSKEQLDVVLSHAMELQGEYVVGSASPYEGLSSSIQ